MWLGSWRRQVLGELDDLRFLSSYDGSTDWDTTPGYWCHTLELERDGWKVEEPKEEWPKKGVDYWTLADIGDENPILKSNWANDWIDQKRLKRGLVFRTQEEAQAWFDKTFGKDNSLEEKKV